MTRSTALRAALILTRPAQWPILTAQLSLGLLLAAPAAGAAWPVWLDQLSWLRLGIAWLAWVVLLNGGTLAFNSAYDKDTGPVAYLANPPVPPNWLAKAAAGAMLLGGVIGFAFVTPLFGFVVSGCAVLSVLYSHPATRWKSRPGLDLLVNVIGYGAGTTLAGLSILQSGPPQASGWWFTAGFGLLFGSFYPLTQIYQTASDRQRGDRTLTTALGNRRSLALAQGLGLAAGAALLQGCRIAGRDQWWGLLAGAMLLWCGHLAWWWRRADQWPDKDHERGMYRALGLWATVDIALAVVWLHA